MLLNKLKNKMNKNIGDLINISYSEKPIISLIIGEEISEGEEWFILLNKDYSKSKITKDWKISEPSESEAKRFYDNLVDNTEGIETLCLSSNDLNKSYRGTIKKQSFVSNIRDLWDEVDRIIYTPLTNKNRIIILKNRYGDITQ